MTDKDKIREKVEELQEQAEYNYDICTTQHEMQFWLGEQSVLTKLKEYIDSLQEEPVSEDLEQAAIAAADEDMQGRQIMEESNENRQLYSRIFRRGFKAGAKWQKQQMMKDAITVTILPANLEETEFCLDDYDEVKHITRLVKEENLKIGDKVKVIVIKEE